MKQLLLVVDYQVDFVDGSLGFAGAEALDGPIAQRIARARADGWDVAFTMDTHNAGYPDTQEGRKLPVPHCLLNSDGWQLYGQTGKSLCKETDMVVCKPTFPSLWLGNWLKQQGYDTVELCGLVSHICVLSNAVMVKAALPEAEIVVDAHLTDSYDPVLHQKALDVLEGLQVTVLHRDRADSI